MKIILLQDAHGLGKRNDIKIVSDGYAVNFLFPKKRAIPATAENIARNTTFIKNEERRDAMLHEWAEKLEKEPLLFTLKTGAQGEVFNSITKDDIKKALAERGYTAIKNIELEKPIHTVGAHQAIIDLGKGIKITLAITAR